MNNALFPINLVLSAISIERRRRLRGPLGHLATGIMARNPYLLDHEREREARRVVWTLRVAFLAGLLSGPVIRLMIIILYQMIGG